MEGPWPVTLAASCPPFSSEASGSVLEVGALSPQSLEDTCVGKGASLFLPIRGNLSPLSILGKMFFCQPGLLTPSMERSPPGGMVGTGLLEPQASLGQPGLGAGAPWTEQITRHHQLKAVMSRAWGQGWESYELLFCPVQGPWPDPP